LLNKVSAKAGTDDDDDDDDMDDGGGVLAVAAKDHRSGNIRSPMSAFAHHELTLTPRSGCHR